MALERHPHFRGRSDWVKCTCNNGQLVLEGLLPTYYLKQLVQEILRNHSGVTRVDNRIEVANPLGQLNRLDKSGDESSGNCRPDKNRRVPR